MKSLICLHVCSLSLFLEGELCESRELWEPVKYLLGGITFIVVSTHSKCLVDVGSVQSLGILSLILKAPGLLQAPPSLGG